MQSSLIKSLNESIRNMVEKWQAGNDLDQKEIDLLKEDAYDLFMAITESKNCKGFCPTCGREDEEEIYDSTGRVWGSLIPNTVIMVSAHETLQIVITGFLSNIISCDKSWPTRTEVSYTRFENEKNKVYYSCSDVIVEIQKPIRMTIPLSGILMPDQS
jgi:hypothetical protein